MTERVEAPLKSNLLISFDGRVLEVFSGTNDGSTRFHVELIKGIGVVDGRILGTSLKVLMVGGGQSLYPFADEHRSGVERLVQAVWAVRGAA